MDETLGTPKHRLIRQPSDAEFVVRDWVRFWGQADAIRVGGSSDAGVDVESSEYVIQVKASTGVVGRPVVQQTFGEAVHRSKRALVFSLGGFTEEALDWASGAGVGLFEFDLQGTPNPLNQSAAVLASNRSGPDGQIGRLLVSSAQEVKSLIVDDESTDGNYLVIGDRRFRDDVGRLLTRASDTPMESAPIERQGDSSLKVWWYDRRLHEEAGALAAVLSNLHPGDRLAVISIEGLTDRQAETLLRALVDRKFDLLLGDGQTAQLITVDLPSFSLVGVSASPGRIPMELRSQFGEWLIQTDGV